MAYTIDLLFPVRTAMLDRIDTGAGRPAFKIYRSDDTLLATLELDDPAGEVSETTGVITLTPGDPESNAPESGTAAYAQLVDGDGVVLENNIPVEQGTVAQSGKVILSSTNVLLGGSVELISASIGG